MSDRLHDRIKTFILNNFLFTDDASAIGSDDSLLDQGIVDSTGMLEIIMFLEEELGVTVKDEEMVPEHLDSVNKLVSFASIRLKAA